MDRLSSATACLFLVACSTADPPSAGVFGAPPPSLLQPETASDGGPLVERSEAELRGQLADGTDPAGAALALVRLLDDEGRQREAIPVLDRALQQAPGELSLRVARAGVLRDLGRRHEAAAVLAGLVADAGAAAVHPGLLHELAELQWLEGDRVASGATVRALVTVHGGHPWIAAHASELQQLQQDLQHAAAPSRLSVRDLLGNLRGCPDPAERRRTLAELVAVGGAVAARAVAAGLDDEDPGVRAAAVGSADVDAAALPELCALALSDPAPAVRCAGAARAAALPATSAIALLLPTLAAETDPQAFAAEHAVLRTCSGRGPELPAEAAADPARRAAVVAEWRREWRL